MNYEHVLLPAGVVAGAEEAEGYLAAQEGLAEAAVVAEMRAEVEKRDAELPPADTFLGGDPVGIGTALFVASPYDAIGYVRHLLFEIATPRGYAIYDPQLMWLVSPTNHVPALVTHGGAGHYPYLTEDVLRQWIPDLAPPNPYLIAERGDHDYIQTYRAKPSEYTVEYRAGGPDQHYATVVNDPAVVIKLIWAWATGQTSALAGVPWERVEL
ncbi:hypothetical protein IU433_28815 [Nocardia puris]|uniref:Uncharacterized protein n=1 Tax=Nocardia puris TaxID=208602 RepID=A0A366D2E0_9NOCA|nr:hypothetical protein [Nocardia puris]MBF6213882.1 hypothetical protein [Nocardia puris]MBF6368521.1 hypothetical protein [Nocardia puris]MBF6463008.1 hypothetical protein [Nocardia puris]RBO84247.1 hypothetical protein DFR74_11766 [Nocardia puris]